MEYESNSSVEAKFVKDLDKVGGFFAIVFQNHIGVITLELCCV